MGESCRHNQRRCSAHFDAIFENPNTVRELMDYVMATQAAAYPVSPTSFATESAFAEHLRELRKSANGRFDRLVLVAPALSDAQYNAQKHHLEVLDLAQDGALFIPSHPAEASTTQFWTKYASPLWKKLDGLLANATLVHADLATDFRRPMTAIAALAARLRRIPVVFVTDIDFRMNAQRMRRLGDGGLSKYLANRLLVEPFKSTQVWLAVRYHQLVMLKSAAMVRDFGHGRPHVKNFYDTVHGPEDVLTTAEAQQRLRFLTAPDTPLNLCFFGRLAANKGVDRMIHATGLARTKGANARLLIIGDGPELENLKSKVTVEGLTDHVTFKGQVPYGRPLFDLLEGVHILLAAPLLEDTPRSAFDAMARGVPILAFDTSYFQDLASGSGGVALAPWPEPEGLAEQIVMLDQSRDRLAMMAQNGLKFAQDNTQRAWLERRMGWTLQFALNAQRADQT